MNSSTTFNIFSLSFSLQFQKTQYNINEEDTDDEKTEEYNINEEDTDDEKTEEYNINEEDTD